MKTITIKLGSREAIELCRMLDWAAADLDADQSEGRPQVSRKHAAAAYRAMTKLGRELARP